MKTILAISLLLIAVGAVAACDLNPAKACDTEIVEPVNSPDHPDSIEAITRSGCDHAPQTHRVSIWISEQSPTNAWLDVPGADLNRVTVCEDVPSPGHDVACTRLVPCVRGVYKARFTVYGTGYDQNANLTSFSWSGESKQVAIECGP